jgi:2-haloacid dehalogenase
MNQRFAEIAAPALTARVWFASLLRDGIALTAAGSFARFNAIGEEALRAGLASTGIDRDIDDAVQHVTDGFTDLDPDMTDVVPRLRAAGLRLVTSPTAQPTLASGALASGPHYASPG